jgi:hypothetical protein
VRLLLDESLPRRQLGLSAVFATTQLTWVALATNSAGARRPAAECLRAAAR